MPSLVRPIVSVGFLVSSLIDNAAAAKSWTINDNAYHSYFNIEGDATDDLRKGTNVILNGEKYSVHLTHPFDNGKNTYIQLDKDHGASTGDEVFLSDDQARISDDAGVSSTTVSTTPEPVAEVADSGFSADIEFATVVNVDDVKAEVRARKKPAVVFVTQPWCGACKHIKASINKNEDFKNMLEEDFIAVHAAGDDGAQWQVEGSNDGYIPRIYFLSPSGDFIKATSPNPEYKYFFPDAGSIQKAMTKVLAELSQKDEL